MNEISQQVDSRINVVDDYDQPLTPKGLRDAISSALSAQDEGKIEEVNCHKTVKAISYTSHDNKRHVFFAKAVTFLGGNGNHPTFKKRIQLANWFKDEYCNFATKGYKVHFLGVYHYKGNIIFVDFDTASYLSGKFNNCSAFVYVSDLFRAMKDGVSRRMCVNNHTITTIRNDKFCEYISGRETASSYGDLIQVFDLFNHTIPFGEKIEGVNAIKEMQQANWPKWRETEWPGWLLEYKFASFLVEKSVSTIIYQGNESKRAEAYDFDLYFPANRFYGDLKASDILKKEAPGNDWQSLHDVVYRFDRFWYAVYEHETEKDADFGNPVTRFRAELILSVDSKTISPTSYASRMKKSVNFKKMMILEINRSNFDYALGVFNQGHQPDGKPRAKKTMIKKVDIDNYLVYKYES